MSVKISQRLHSMAYLHAINRAAMGRHMWGVTSSDAENASKGDGGVLGLDVASGLANDIIGRHRQPTPTTRSIRAGASRDKHASVQLAGLKCVEC